MPEKQVDEELKRLCEVAVAGLDQDMDALSEPSLEWLALALQTRESKIVLDWCKIASESDDMLQGGNYEGGYDGNGEYSFGFWDLDMDREDEEALITLTEEEVRQVASGEKTFVEFKYRYSANLPD